MKQASLCGRSTTHKLLNVFGALLDVRHSPNIKEILCNIEETNDATLRKQQKP